MTARLHPHFGSLGVDRNLHDLALIISTQFQGLAMNQSTGGDPSLRDVSEILESLNACRSLVRKPKQPPTGIRLLTTGFEIVAECDLGGERISDLLNQTLSGFLACSNAKLFRYGHYIETIDSLDVRKSEIVIGGIIGVIHEAPVKQMGNRRSLDQFQAVAAADRWIIKGRLHMTSNRSVKDFLHSNQDFFPIANAVITDADCPERTDEMKVAIVNRARVSFMQITEFDANGQDSAVIFDQKPVTQ